MTDINIARRSLFKSGGALIVSFALPSGALFGLAGTASARAPNRPLDPAALDSWIAISADNTVTVFWGKMDMGQGTDTGICIMAAEELDVDIDRVNIIQGDTALTVDQGGASGSTGLQRSGVALRAAAAEARRVLLELAAAELEVPASQLQVADGTVSVTSDPDRSVTYGELIGNRHFSTTLEWNGNYGNSLALRGQAQPKPKDQYTLIGGEIARKDVPGKVMATEDFAHHLRIPGMVHARTLRPPHAGGVPVDVDEGSIAHLDAQVVWVKDFLAVVAETEWDAVLAARELAVSWSDPGPQLQTNTEEVHDYIRAAEVKSQNHTTDEGDIEAVLANASRVVRAEYEFPFQSHARMAPAFGLVDVRDGGATAWTDSQKPHRVAPGIADVLGIPLEQVRSIWVQGPGSYGRSDADDGAIDAAVISAEIGRPVRVQWTREEGIAWDPKGVASVATAAAALDDHGNVLGYLYEMKSFSRVNMASSGNHSGAVLAGHLLGRQPQNGYGSRSPEQSYQFPTMRYTQNVIDPLMRTASPMRTAHFRDPMGPAVHFGQECFIDEVAEAAGLDPVEFRLRHLTDPRDRAVVELAAERAGWESRVGPNPNAAQGDVLVGRGMGYAQRNGATNAVVAHVEVNPTTGRVWVRKFTVGSDHGLIVNRKSIIPTIEGNLIQALSRTLLEEVEFDEVMVRSNDWFSYPIIEMADVPEEIEIAMIDRPELDPRGAGEPTTRIVPGAVANAVYDATGVRMRKLPLTPARVLEELEGASA